jgi:hypothetical protein
VLALLPACAEVAFVLEGAGVGGRR